MDLNEPDTTLAGIVGTIEKGKLADLLLFKGNPLRRIDLLRDRSRIIGVMQSGRFVAGAWPNTAGQSLVTVCSRCR